MAPSDSTLVKDSSSRHETASSSVSTLVGEPVLNDSLTYWERQSATYNGVLGLCRYPLSHLPAHQSFHIQLGQADTALVYALLSQRFVKLTWGSYVVTSPR